MFTSLTSRKYTPKTLVRMEGRSRQNSAMIYIYWDNDRYIQGSRYMHTLIDISTVYTHGSRSIHAWITIYTRRDHDLYMQALRCTREKHDIYTQGSRYPSRVTIYRPTYRVHDLYIRGSRSIHAGITIYTCGDDDIYT